MQIEFQSSAICHITNDYIDDNTATIYNDVLRSRLQSRQMNNIKAGWRRKADVVFGVQTRDLAIQVGL